MTKFEHYLSGNIFGIKYVFENADDGLPRHKHDSVTAHNVVVMRGKVNVLFYGYTETLEEGDIYDFDGSIPHAIRAVTPDACILNVFLNGQPEEYKKLPSEELKGEFDVRNFSNRELT